MQRIIETTGAQSIQIQEDSPEDQAFFPGTSQGQDDDEPEYPGEYNVWMCYGTNPCALCMTNMQVGPIRAGEAFPSGHTAPPAHDRCQCELEAADPNTWQWPIILIPPRRGKKKPEKAIPVGRKPDRDENKEK